jgi:hypothetical protein
LKTSRDTLPAGCMTYCQTWQEWVTQQRGDYSRRLKLAHPIYASESSSWPTVTVGEEKYRIQGDTQASKCLSAMAARGELAGQHDQANPSTTGRSQGSANWATPIQGDAHLGSSQEAAQRRLAEGKSTLSRQTEATAQGKLNPDWVCQLMGIPVGWVHPEGVRNRTDELRMLGNGVVPQTAAKAFTTLAGRFHA